MSEVVDRLLRLVDPSGAKYPMPPPPDAGVPVYPSQRYIEKNWAPEKKLRFRDIEALGRARRQAEQTGVLAPDLAENMLPMAITEGRGGNYGILQNSAFYAKPATVDRFKKMGLETDGAFAPLAFQDIPGKGKHIGPSGFQAGNSDVYARIMAAIMGEKAALVPKGDTDAAVKRYNGKGRAIEDVDGVKQRADVDAYLSKVKQAREMLAHPKNKLLLDYFNSSYKGAFE